MFFFRLAELRAITPFNDVLREAGMTDTGTALFCVQKGWSSLLIIRVNGVLGLFVAGLVALYFGAAVLVQRVVLFPTPPTYAAAGPPKDARTFHLNSGAESVEAWYLPPFAGL